LVAEKGLDKNVILLLIFFFYIYKYFALNFICCFTLEQANPQK